MPPTIAPLADRVERREVDHVAIEQARVAVEGARGEVEAVVDGRLRAVGAAERDAARGRLQRADLGRSAGCREGVFQARDRPDWAPAGGADRAGDVDKEAPRHDEYEVRRDVPEAAIEGGPHLALEVGERAAAGVERAHFGDRKQAVGGHLGLQHAGVPSSEAHGEDVSRAETVGRGVDGALDHDRRAGAAVGPASDGAQ